MERVEVVVVGGGVMGSAAASSLAARGREVVLLERFEIGHRRGSSHGDVRVFRLSYDAPAWVRMMGEALSLWRRLEEAAGESLLTTTGGLDLDPPPQNAESLDAVGVPYEVLPAGEAMQRYPTVSIPPDTEVLLQEDAGIVAAERGWRAFGATAAAAGAVIREGVRVVRLQPDGEGVLVETEDGSYRCRVAVVTAGAWSGGLLGPAGIDLDVHVTLETPAYFRTGKQPPVVVEWRDPPIYALPSSHGLKAAQHHVGPRVDPDDETLTPFLPSLDHVRRWVGERFPDADPEPVHAETCLYTSTADEGFILERRGPIVVGSACSGHGFKFAPVIGERLAELALGD